MSPGTGEFQTCADGISCSAWHGAGVFESTRSGISPARSSLVGHPTRAYISNGLSKNRIQTQSAGFPRIPRDYSHPVPVQIFLFIAGRALGCLGDARDGEFMTAAAM